MRRGKVYYGKHLAGTILETADGTFEFTYDPAYVEAFPKQFITFSMPVRSESYVDNRFFPFFEGLIPEGWLLEIAAKTWKINSNDRMGLLLTCCENCIGAVSVVNNPTNEE